MIPNEQVKLSSMSNAAGCSAKIGPGTLSLILSNLPKFEDENLLVGVETSDDAAVYQLTEELALIQTLDFFPPMVDDAYAFGQIAAANALSDVYAMGGTPKVALNIVAWPNCVDPMILGEILRGGADKVKEAGAILAGGHSIEDESPKYGLSVSGIVSPKAMWKNQGAMPGDVLILTKPIGSGILNTAIKAELASEEELKRTIEVMSTLNRKAKEAAEELDIHCCTDITGFGLAGHLLEIARASQVTIEVDMSRVKILPGVKEHAAMGLIPQGSYKNRKFVGNDVDISTVSELTQDIFFDPQTSGGLLFSLSESNAHVLMERLRAAGLEEDCSIVGKVTTLQSSMIIVKE